MLKKNQLIIGISLFVLVILGILGYILYGKTLTANRNSIPTASKSTSKTSQTPIQASIKDLFTSGQNRKCVFDINGPGTKTTNGTVYATGNDIAAVFISTTDGKESKINLIKNNDTYYIWGDNLTTGIKMTLSTDDMINKLQQSQYGGLNTESKVNYNCSNWTPDQTIFKIPSSVNFIDAGVMAPKIPVTDKTKGTVQYSCADIKDPIIKASCENAMKK